MSGVVQQDEIGIETSADLYTLIIHQCSSLHFHLQINNITFIFQEPQQKTKVVHILPSFWATIGRFGQALREKIRLEISAKLRNYSLA